MSEFDLESVMQGSNHLPIAKVVESNRSLPLESGRENAMPGRELVAWLGDLMHSVSELWRRPAANSETPHYRSQSKLDWTEELTARFGMPLYAWHRRIGPVADGRAVHVPYGIDAIVTVYGQSVWFEDNVKKLPFINLCLCQLQESLYVE